ncbi:MAG: protein translocase SEC61 complex subunit gamma [Candidatus Micrarchaeia archaeon]
MDIIVFLKECRRVLYVATRPRRKEFEKIVKITGLGIILVGLMGVLISFLLSLTEVRA